MAGSLTPFDKFVQGQIDGSHFIDFDDPAVVVKLALFTSAYTPDLAAHEFFGDITDETSGTNYTAGGETLTGKAVGLDTSGSPHFIYWNGDDITFGNVTITFRYGVLYWDDGGSQPVIALIDFGADQTPAGIDYLVQWSDITAGGIIKFQVAA